MYLWHSLLQVKGEDKMRARSLTIVSQTVRWNDPSGTDFPPSVCTEPRKKGWHPVILPQPHSSAASLRAGCSKKQRETEASVCLWAQAEPSVSQKINNARNV